MGRDHSSNGHSAASYKEEQNQQKRAKIYTSDTGVSALDCLGVTRTQITVPSSFPLQHDNQLESEGSREKDTTATFQLHFLTDLQVLHFHSNCRINMVSSAWTGNALPSLWLFFCPPLDLLQQVHVFLVLFVYLHYIKIQCSEHICSCKGGHDKIPWSAG